MDKWTKKHPLAPKHEPSSYYWFLGDGEKFESIVEVWVNRKWFPQGYWGPMIKRIRKDKE